VRSTWGKSTERCRPFALMPATAITYNIAKPTINSSTDPENNPGSGTDFPPGVLDIPPPSDTSLLSHFGHRRHPPPSPFPQCDPAFTLLLELVIVNGKRPLKLRFQFQSGHEFVRCEKYPVRVLAFQLSERRRCGVQSGGENAHSVQSRRRKY